MSTTNNVAGPEKRFTLAELSNVMMDRERVPYGFFVSQALWNNISGRLKVETGLGMGMAPVTMHGTKLAVDPSMPDAEFDVAFTEEAWRERLSKLSNGERS